jgi:hypothetical protein
MASNLPRLTSLSHGGKPDLILETGDFGMLESE